MRLLLFLTALVVGFEGLRIALLSSYHSRITGLVMVALGFLYLRFFSKTNLEKYKNPVLPILGTFVIVGVVAFNMISVGSLELNSMDQMMLMFGLILTVYNYIPKKFENEARFISLFFGIFAVILILPIIGMNTLMYLSDGAYNEKVAGEVYTHYFIELPLIIPLKILGVKYSVSANIVSFDFSGLEVRARIGMSCSGLYSMGVFVSGLIAFMQTKYQSLGRRHLYLIIFGIITAYLANLIRMLAIILAGHWYGPRWFGIVHMQFGWIIFMFWVLVFWYLGFKYFIRE